MLLRSGCIWAAEPIRVFAASSLSEALDEIAVGFRAKTGDAVEFNFAASGTLARQIEAGAPADLFFSADRMTVDDLSKAGLVDDVSVVDVLSNRLVLIVPTGDQSGVKRWEDLADKAVRRIAIGTPGAVPVGTYARAFLEQRGWWDALAGRVMNCVSARGVLAAVASGNVDAGIVFRTDADQSAEVRVVAAVDPDDGPEIVYVLAAVNRPGGVRPATARFRRFLTSEVAADIFRRQGFVAPKSEPSQ